MPRTKRVRSKGHEYLYFKTSRVNAQGRPVYVKLPALNDHSFGSVYASLMAGVNRKPATYLTVTAFIELYKASPKFESLADNTQKLYSIYLRAFQEALPTAPAGRVERSDIARLVDKRSDKPGAANGILRSIGALYKWGRSRGHVENAPNKDIDLYDEGEHKEWPDEVLEAALESDDPLVKLAVSLLYYTGQRIGDTCKMRWSDIRNGVIEITQEKRKHVMSIPVHDALEELLAVTPKRGLTILAHDTGKRYSADYIRLHLQKWVRVNFKLEVVPHGLRKNAVNSLLECGGSVGEVSAITGQSLQEVERYARGRNRPKLAKAMIFKWNAVRTGKRKENLP